MAKVGDIRAVARERFGFRRLRPGQAEAIGAILEGRDAIAVMPTGAGKSAIYQIAALMIPGPTIVVSPLVALQRDQAERLENGRRRRRADRQFARPGRRSELGVRGPWRSRRIAIDSVRFSLPGRRPVLHRQLGRAP